MKKIKVITISILSLLLFVPFIGFSKAQVPSYVGLEVGDYIEWDQNIYVGASWEIWDTWDADNMTAHWGAPFGHIPDYTDMDTLIGSLLKAGPGNPVYVYTAEIESIVPDTGQTLVNSSSSMYLVAELTDLPFDTTYIISNDSASFAEDAWYGGMASMPFLAANSGGYYYTNSLLFAPKGINWDDFAGNCTGGLDDRYDLSLNYSTYTLDVNALSNGFQLYSPIDGFGNNSVAITINVTYDSDGVLESYTFEYGSELLVEIVRGETEGPVFPWGRPEDITLAYDYTNESMYWLVSSADPHTYAILTNDTEVLVSPTEYTEGYIVFDIPDGLTPGEDHLIKINLQDGRNNLATDEVIITVEPAPEPEPDPVIPGYDLSIVLGAFAIGTISIILRKKKK